MEVPTARVMKENSYRFGAGQVYPYRYYHAAAGLFGRLEIDGRITEVLGVKASPEDPNWSGYGNEKDKALDVKYQFWREGKYSPALSLGIMDPQGTRLYSSQYLVASKQLYPFDFTLGFGNGRFGKEPLSPSGDSFKVEMFTSPRQWASDSQLWWGIQFSPSDRYSFMVEYNPIRYNRQTNDPAQRAHFTRPVPLQYNFGLRWRPYRWAEIDLTYQRGNQFGANLSLAFDIGRPFIPIYDKPYKENPRHALLPPSERIAIALKEQGFSDIGVDEEKGTLLIRAQNDKYFYSMRAISVIVRTVGVFAAPSVHEVRITLTQTGIPIVEVVTTRAYVQELCAGRLSNDDFFYVSKITTDLRRAPDIPTKDSKLFTPGVRPVLQTYLNDPSGFFRYRLGAEGWIAYHPWTGTSVVGSLEAYAINNISSSNIPPDEAVRSDIFRYRRHDLNLGRLMLDQIYKPAPDLYTRFAAGFLEIEYAGIDAEVAVPLKDGRFLAGLQSSLVKKRDPGAPFKLKEGDVKRYYDVEFINTRLNIPEVNMAVDLKTGRFLGGDFGARMTIMKYINGITIFAWYTATDTSVFKDRFNRGYHDKGIGVTIPMRLFEGTDTRTYYKYSLSPWTRDTGQDLDRYQTLFGFMGRDTKVFLQRDKKVMEPEFARPARPPAPVPAEADAILAPADGLFKAMKSKDYAEIWPLLSARSCRVIVSDVHDAVRDEDVPQGSLEAIEKDFMAGGAIAGAYWAAFLSSFDPDTVLEESTWEIGEVRKQTAEITLIHKKAVHPARLKMFKENGQWKVGLVETFWGK